MRGAALPPAPRAPRRQSRAARQPVGSARLRLVEPAAEAAGVKPQQAAVVEPRAELDVLRRDRHVAALTAFSPARGDHDVATVVAPKVAADDLGAKRSPRGHL